MKGLHGLELHVVTVLGAWGRGVSRVKRRNVKTRCLVHNKTTPVIRWHLGGLAPNWAG